MKIQKKYQGIIPNGKIMSSEFLSDVDTYSCNYLNNKFNDIDKLNNKSIITGKYTGYTGSSGNYMIKMQQTAKIGEGLGINANGFIEVLSDDVTHVLVSALGFAYDSTSGANGTTLYKNDTAINYAVSTGQYRTIGFSPILVEVKKGDVFKLKQEFLPNYHQDIGPNMTVQQVN